MAQKAIARVISDSLFIDLLPLLALYEGSPSLQAVYAVDAEIQKVLSRKVYLPCGGFLIFDTTEAMTVIDVNSGRNNVSGKSADLYRKVNLEAATEIARQIRLRNCSGIILVDFVNLSSEEEQRLLLEHLRKVLSKDPVPTQAVDFTRLGLAEITRKKIYRPFRETLIRKAE